MTPKADLPRANAPSPITLRRKALVSIGVAVLGLAAIYSLTFGAASPSGLWSLIRSDGRIGPGYIGISEFGQWRLICMPEPQALEELAARVEPETAAPQPGVARANACRINQEMPAEGQDEADGPEGQNPKAVIVAANFSLVGANRTPSAMLRLPSTARAGDVIVMRLDDDAEIHTTVRACASGECMAAGPVGEAEWARLGQAKSLQVKIPAAERQWVLLDLSVDGLDEAIAAMNRAEISANE